MCAYSCSHVRFSSHALKYIIDYECWWISVGPVTTALDQNRSNVIEINKNKNKLDDREIWVYPCAVCTQYRPVDVKKMLNKNERGLTHNY